MKFSEKFIQQTIEICKLIDLNTIESVANEISKIRDQSGRIFFIGSGGGAGHASHAVNDFRKIANIECYTPTDNVSELTARINDDGWDSSYLNYLKCSNFSKKDAIFIFSVGGGSREKNISVNLIKCLELANSIGSSILGIVGKDGGFAAQVSEHIIKIPVVDDELITPHTEGWQAVAWHLLVSHPLVLQNSMKWESQK